MQAPAVSAGQTSVTDASKPGEAIIAVRSDASQPHTLAPPGDHVGHRAVLDHHALRATGRTRGVDDVGEVAGDGASRAPGRQDHQARASSSSDRQPGRDPVGRTRVRHHQHDAGVLAHVGEAVGRVRRGPSAGSAAPARRIASSAMTRSALRGRQVATTDLRPGAAALELGGQPIGRGAQLGVGQLAAVPAHGRRLGRTPHPVGHRPRAPAGRSQPPGRRGSIAARARPPPGTAAPAG